MPDRADTPPQRQEDRSVAELRLRRLREDLVADPRGDRARQGRDLRESRQAPARLGRRHRRRRLRLPRPDPGHGRDRLAAQRRGLRRQRLARLLRRGRALPADRRRRRLLRLPLAQGRRAADARAGDRGGEADQGDAGMERRRAGMSSDARAAPPSTAGVPGRSAAQIRRDIDLQRRDLGTLGRSCCAAASPS